MALYTIGDLHLSLAKEKPMDIFGDSWRKHDEKLKDAFSRLTDEDLTVLCGDMSWGMSLEETAPDFHFVDALPGKKIILKGNHDYWWNTAAKIKRFFEQEEIKSIEILHNNAFTYGEYGGEHDAKIMRREIMRLEASLKAAGNRKKLVFLHYPPIYGTYRCNEILQLLKEHRVPLCCYGHIHGKGCAGAFNGWYEGTQFKLVSADYVNFTPVRLPFFQDV